MDFKDSEIDKETKSLLKKLNSMSKEEKVKAFVAAKLIAPPKKEELSELGKIEAGIALENWIDDFEYKLRKIQQRRGKYNETEIKKELENLANEYGYPVWLKDEDVSHNWGWGWEVFIPANVTTNMEEIWSLERSFITGESTDRHEHGAWSHSSAC